jgi:hypothetical protein
MYETLVMVHVSHQAVSFTKGNTLLNYCLRIIKSLI